MILIKPHHFMDIIKLYGAGIEKFVPDKNYNHNFYLIANEIITNPQVPIKTTIEKDDICSPCKYLGENGACIDCITHINGINLKDEWNKIIDKRIIKYSNILCNNIYSANEYCEILYSIKEKIFDIWKEEDISTAYHRYNNFSAGAQKYLSK